MKLISKQINNDIQRLNQVGQGAFGEYRNTKCGIEALNQEINRLSDQMEIDDSDKIIGLWRSKRRELSELKQGSDGLTHPCYKLFNDSERFIRIDHAKELSQSLSRRIDVLKTYRTRTC